MPEAGDSQILRKSPGVFRLTSSHGSSSTSRCAAAGLQGLVCLFALNALLPAVEPLMFQQPASSLPIRSVVTPASAARPRTKFGPKAPQTLSLPCCPFNASAIHPVRVIRLINGDSVTAEILAGDREFLHLRLFGDHCVRIPQTTLESVSSLPGDRELVNEKFSDASPQGTLIVSSDQPSRAIRLPAVSDHGRGWFRFRLADGERKPSPPGTGWTWHFAEGGQLRAQLDAHGRWQAVTQNLPGTPSTHQRIAARSGWQIGRMQMLGGRLVMSLDGQLLFAGPSPGRGPEALEFTANSGQGALATSLHVDHLVFVAANVNEPPVQPRFLHSEDEIAGAGGETWWGNLKSIGQHGVEWSDGDILWQRLWPQIRSVARRSPRNPVPGKLLRGRIVRIELQPSTDRPDMPGDRLTVALESSDSGRLLVNHLLWGRLAIPHSAIRRVESLLLGEMRLLDARERQFGGRSERRQPALAERPGDPAGSFLLDNVSRSAVFFALEAAGLEPSGPGTPPGSPTLNDLRAGRRGVELHVNGRRVGAFNELTSQWSLPGQFDRLRLRLPAQVLQQGDNTWHICRSQGSPILSTNDDCRLRNLSLEIEAAHPVP